MLDCAHMLAGIPPKISVLSFMGHRAGTVQHAIRALLLPHSCNRQMMHGQVACPNDLDVENQPPISAIRPMCELRVPPRVFTGSGSAVLVILTGGGTTEKCNRFFPPVAKQRCWKQPSRNHSIEYVLKDTTEGDGTRGTAIDRSKSDQELQESSRP
jgi:hypothetical protein